MYQILNCESEAGAVSLQLGHHQLATDVAHRRHLVDEVVRVEVVEPGLGRPVSIAPS